MGIDGLDLVFRIEKSFGVQLTRSNEVLRLLLTEEQLRLQPKQQQYTHATVGEIHQRLCVLLREKNTPVPEDSLCALSSASATH